MIKIAKKDREITVDTLTRRQKQQALMTQLLERKIRLRAQALYDSRGQVEGLALQDWAQAESEVLENSILADFYRRVKSVSEGVYAGEEATAQVPA
jgi:Protein of unknown function (DUF2934)